MEVTKYAVLPNDEEPYWLFKAGQNSPATYTLNSTNYLETENFSHHFYYERNPANWITLTYDSEIVSTGAAMPGFDMGGPETVKKNIEITKNIPNFSNYTLMGYRVNGSTTIYPLTSSSFSYIPTTDATITFVYEEADPNLVGTKTIIESMVDGTASAGETLSYTISYTNNGNLTAENVIIKDLLDDIEFVGSTVSNLKVNTVANLGDITTGINVGNLAAGAVVNVTFDITLASPLPAGDGKLKNIATSTDETGTPPEVEIPTDAGPALVGTKSIVEGTTDGRATAGETLTYTITYTNNGNLAAENVIIKDLLDDTEFAGSTISNLKINTVANSGDIRTGINVGNLAAGAVVSVTFDITLASPLPTGNGTLKNIVTSTDELGTPPEVEIPTEAGANISGTKSVVDGNLNGIADAGETLTYTITYTNNGNLKAENITIIDSLNDTEFARSVVTDLVVDGHTHPGDITTGINIAEIEAGQTIIITFNVTLANPLPVGDGILKNIATLTDEDGTNHDVEKEIPTDAAPHLAGTKTVSEPSGDNQANTGETLTYTISFTNEGNIDAENVIIKDKLDDIEFAGSTVSNLQVNGISTTGDITTGINAGSLIPGATVIVIFDVTLAVPLPIGDGILKNIVTANGFTAEAEIPVEQIEPLFGAEYMGSKSVIDADGDGIAIAGEILSYTITYKNTGDKTGTDLIIKDALADTEFAGSVVSNLQVNGIAVDRDITTGINVGALAPGEKVVVTFDVKLANPLPAGDGVVTNIATINDGDEIEVVIPIYYRVVYDGNGHNSGFAPADDTRYLAGTTATILDKNTLVKDNHTFLGWSTNKDYQVAATTMRGVGVDANVLYQKDDMIIITSDVTLYAVWSEDAVVPPTSTELPTTGQNDIYLIMALFMLAISGAIVFFRKRYLSTNK